MRLASAGPSSASPAPAFAIETSVSSAFRGQALPDAMLSKNVEMLKNCDGAVASGQPGIFGAAQAYFAPVETQGRGGIHAHMCVWVRHPVSGSATDQAQVSLGSTTDQGFEIMNRVATRSAKACL